MYVPQTHKLAHRRVDAKWLKMLQSYRLILNPGSHAHHHRDNAKAYCVFTGWLNPVLDQANFWHGLELVFQRYKTQPE